MPQFHAGAIRNNGGWLVRIAELDETTTARHRSEITSRALDLIMSKPGMAGAEIDLLIQRPPPVRHFVTPAAVHRTARRGRNGRFLR